MFCPQVHKVGLFQGGRCLGFLYDCQTRIDDVGNQMENYISRFLALLLFNTKSQGRVLLAENRKGVLEFHVHLLDSGVLVLEPVILPLKLLEFPAELLVVKQDLFDQIVVFTLTGRFHKYLREALGLIALTGLACNWRDMESRQESAGIHSVSGSRRLGSLLGQEVEVGLRVAVLIHSSYQIVIREPEFQINLSLIMSESTRTQNVCMGVLIDAFLGAGHSAIPSIQVGWGVKLLSGPEMLRHFKQKPKQTFRLNLSSKQPSTEPGHPGLIVNDDAPKTPLCQTIRTVQNFVYSKMYVQRRVRSDQKIILYIEIYFIVMKSGLGTHHDNQSFPKLNAKSQAILDLNNNIIVDRIDQGEYLLARESLIDMEAVINTADYQECEQLEYQHRQVLHYNLACVFQKTWKTQECCMHLSKALLCVVKQTKICKDPTRRLMLQVENSRIMLQYCAVLSQLGNHYEAFRVADTIIRSQKQIYADSLKIVNQRVSLMFSESNSINFNLVGMETVKAMLQEFVCIPISQDIIKECVSKDSRLCEGIYLWKSSPDNNEKMIRKKLGSSVNAKQSGRSVLGIRTQQKCQDWISSFNIGSVMMIKPKKSTDTQNLASRNMLSQKGLMEQMFYSSIAYFTMATQTRLKDIDKEMRDLKQIEKVIRLKDHPSTEICKAFHLKAIELVVKFVSSPTQYISHLIQSFNKNYKSNMDAINQELSMVNSDACEVRVKQPNGRRISTILAQRQDPIGIPINDVQGSEGLLQVEFNQMRKRSMTALREYPKIRMVRSTTKEGLTPKSVRSNSTNINTCSVGFNRFGVSPKVRSSQKTQVRTLTVKFVDEVKVGTPTIKKSKSSKKKKGT